MWATLAPDTSNQRLSQSPGDAPPGRLGGWACARERGLRARGPASLGTIHRASAFHSVFFPLGVRMESHPGAEALVAAATS